MFYYFYQIKSTFSQTRSCQWKRSIFCFLSFIALSFSIPALAEQSAPDSLLKVWEISEDTSGVNKLCSLSNAQGGETSLRYAERALSLSEKLKYKKGLEQANLLLGQYYYHQEKFSTSLDHCIRAFALAKELDDNKAMAVICRYIGYNHYLNEPKTSMEFYQKALEYSRLAGDSLQESYVLSAMGNLYEGWGDAVGALEFHSRSLAIRERIGTPDQQVASILETARAYDRMGMYDKKMELVIRGLEIAEKKGKNDQNLIYLYQMMGFDFIDREKDYKTALEYFLKSYELVKKQNLYDKNNISSIRPVAECYFRLGDFKKSSEYFKLYFDLQEENQKKLDKELYESQFSLKREVEKQELLQKDAEILKQKVELQRKDNLRNLYIAAIIIIIVGVFFVFRSYKMNKNLNVLLEDRVQEKTSALQLSETRLKEVNKELEAFIYKASHDLKGPLISSRSLVSMVKEEKKPAEVMKYIDMIQLSLGKLDNILMSLHEVAVIRQGEIALVKTNIPYEISSLLKHFEGLPNFENIEVGVDNTMKRDFRTDRILIQTILRNVLENAIKYSRTDIPEPRIDVLIEEQGNWNMIRISDNGIGIPKEHHEKVFDMFFRATDTSKGSGLGLYIVKSALDKLKGRVEIQSEPGVGTTFNLYFPA